MATGLVQEREEFILPDDAYPVLENAFVWRERIKRKQGYELLGRLRRVLTSESLGLSQASPWTFNVLSSIGVRGNITAITNANPALLTTDAPHNLVNNQTVIITGVQGMTQVNGLTVTITVVTPTSFTIGINTLLFGVYTSGGFWTLSNQPNATVQCGSVVITIGAIVFTDQGDGTLTSPTPGNSGIINYATGSVTLIHTAGVGVATTISFNYYPGLPVMGLRNRELNNTNNEQTLAFDQVYAYEFVGTGWQEFIPGTTWTGTDFDFFWSTNYWVDRITNPIRKVFWVTNDSGVGGDPIRITNGLAWANFFPGINGTATVAATVFLHQCVAMLPFRSRMVVFNTLEGPTLPLSISYPQRIRWSAIGTPFDIVNAVVTSGVNLLAWSDAVRGQGGYLDIPTSESIISVGYVRDNLVIYCERSTWQLRYTGRSIAPFQIEKVNTELGAESTFSAVQFDTSLVGIGDKGVVECDSFKSNRIDIKIPDLVFQFNNQNNGTKRVHGIRDFVQRLAYWTYPYIPNDGPPVIYPNRRLVYNYENDSWAIFTDSLTTLGNFQPQSGRTWAGTPLAWQSSNFPWINRPALIPEIIGGNQQGYVEYLDQQVTNDISLTIHNITGMVVSPTIITSVAHNLLTDQIISISGIALGTPFASSLNNPQAGLITGATQANPCQITSPLHSLQTGDRVEIDGVVGMTQLNGLTYTITVTGTNTFTLDGIDSTTFGAYVSGGVWTSLGINAFRVERLTADTFRLWVYNPVNGQFDIPQLDPVQVFIGCGNIAIRDGFSIVSKKFNFMDEGQNIQLGHVDALFVDTEDGAVTMYVYINYNEDNPVNILPQNAAQDTFFNSVVPTTNAGALDGSKNWQRVYCPTRGAFLTIQWTLSNGQLVGPEQENDVQLDAQILWVRKAGSQLPIGV